MVLNLHIIGYETCSWVETSAKDLGVDDENYRYCKHRNLIRNDLVNRSKGVAPSLPPK